MLLRLDIWRDLIYLFPHSPFLNIALVTVYHAIEGSAMVEPKDFMLIIYTLDEEPKRPETEDGWDQMGIVLFRQHIPWSWCSGGADGCVRDFLFSFD